MMVKNENSHYQAWMTVSGAAEMKLVYQFVRNYTFILQQ